MLKFIDLLKPYKRKITFYMLVRWLGVGIAMVMPLLTKYLIDEVIKTKNWKLFTIILCLTASLMVISILIGAVISFINTYLEEKTKFDLQKKIHKKWETTSLNYFLKFGVGEQIYRRTTDVANIINALIKTIPTFIMSNSEFIVFFIIAANLNLKLTLIYMLSMPVLILIHIFHSKSVRPVQKEIQEISSNINDSISQNVSGILIIKIFQQEKFQTLKYLNNLSNKIRKIFTKWRIDIKYQSIGWLCNSGWNLLVTFYGWALVIQGKLTLGSLIALSIYLSRLSKPIENYGSLIQSFALASVSAERILEILNTKGEKYEKAKIISRTIPCRKNGAQLILRNVEFGYFEKNAILKNISYVFESGKMIGISGPNGAGKTTLVNLIGRFYEPWKGKLFFNGKNIKSIPLKQFRKCISICPQESFIFHGTIKENIIYGNRKANKDELMEAAKMANIHNFINSLRDGYKTIIGKQLDLSKGQKQKIAIARSIIKGSPIMIFDEGFNSLDILSKTNILNTLYSVTKEENRITILIAHDINTLMLCDEIFIILDGVVYEKGSPEIISNKGYLKYLKMKSHYEEYDQRKNLNRVSLQSLSANNFPLDLERKETN